MHVKDIVNTNPVLIPVMTENVDISCDAEEGEWSYTGYRDIFFVYLNTTIKQLT